MALEDRQHGESGPYQNSVSLEDLRLLCSGVVTQRRFIVQEDISVDEDNDDHLIVLGEAPGNGEDSRESEGTSDIDDDEDSDDSGLVVSKFSSDSSDYYDAEDDEDTYLRHNGK